MKKILIIFLSLYAVNLSLSAQASIAELTGAIKLSFKITSADNTVLNDSEQFLIQRAVSGKDVEPTIGGASAFGYQPYHLEFLSKATIEEGKKKKLKRKYEVRFYDAQDQYLFNWYYSFVRIINLKENSAGYQFACSLNLVGIPLVLLREVKRIDITKI